MKKLKNLQPPFLELHFCFDKKYFDIIMTKVVGYLSKCKIDFKQNANDNTIVFSGLFVKNRAEYLEFYRESFDNHIVLSIITEDIVFEPVHLFGEPESKSQKKGLLIYEKFYDIINELSPLYASIDVEWEMKTPLQLKEDRFNVSFSSGYISNIYCDNQLNNLLKSLNQEVYTEKLDNGIYISSVKFFNPKKIESTEENRGKLLRKIVDNILLVHSK